MNIGGTNWQCDPQRPHSSYFFSIFNITGWRWATWRLASPWRACIAMIAGWCGRLREYHYGAADADSRHPQGMCYGEPNTPARRFDPIRTAAAVLTTHSLLNRQ
jgi:hypothetical protein